MAELVDALDLGSSRLPCESSSLSSRTKKDHGFGKMSIDSRLHMSSVVEKLQGLKRRLSITLPPEKVEQAFDTRMKELTKKVKVPGFRIGKVPKQLLEKKYGQGVLQEVAEELFRSRLHEAIEEHHLHVAGRFTEPRLIQADRGQAFECSIDFEVYPQIALQVMSGEKITRLKAEVTESDIDEVIESLRKQHAEWAPVEREAKEGDRVVIDFEGKIEGVAFEGGSAVDFSFDLGAQKMLPEFESGVLGMKPEEVREVSLKFPEDYLDKTTAGRQAIFKVTLKKLMEPVLPAIDEVFLKKLSPKSKDYSEFREEVRKTVEKGARQLLKEDLNKRVLEKLLEQNSFEVPEALVNAEITQMQNKSRHQIAAEMQLSDKEVANIELPSEPYIAEARKRVQLGLLLSEVVKHYGIKVDAEEVSARIDQIAGNYPNAGKVREFLYKNKQALHEIETGILEDHSVERLLSECQIEEQLISYKEAVKQIDQHRAEEQEKGT